jgi:hypoxanthine phosphoribosyltransferase
MFGINSIMSSSNGMSRSSEEAQFSNEQNSDRQPRYMNGNPTQQLWKICTFHETRIARMEQQIHKLSHESNNKKVQPLEGILQKLNRLEQENASFRKYITDANKKQEKKSVSLAIEEQ